MDKRRSCYRFPSTNACRKNGITILMSPTVAATEDAKSAARNGYCRTGWPFITNSLWKMNNSDSRSPGLPPLYEPVFMRESGSGEQLAGVFGEVGPHCAFRKLINA